MVTWALCFRVSCHFLKVRNNVRTGYVKYWKIPICGGQNSGTLPRSYVMRYSRNTSCCLTCTLRNVDHYIFCWTWQIATVEQHSSVKVGMYCNSFCEGKLGVILEVITVLNETALCVQGDLQPGVCYGGEGWGPCWSRCPGSVTWRHVG